MNNPVPKKSASKIFITKIGDAVDRKTMAWNEIFD